MIHILFDNLHASLQSSLSFHPSKNKKKFQPRNNTHINPEREVRVEGTTDLHIAWAILKNPMMHRDKNGSAVAALLNTVGEYCHYELTRLIDQHHPEKAHTLAQLVYLLKDTSRANF